MGKGETGGGETGGGRREGGGLGDKNFYIQDIILRRHRLKTFVKFQPFSKVFHA